MSSSTTIQPTSIPKFWPGWRAIRAGPFHFTPTSASWLNAVENFFSKMTRQRIRRGVFRSIADLQAAINAYLAEHNNKLPASMPARQAAINAISPSTTPAPNPSSGPNPPRPFWPNSTAALYHPFDSVH